MNTLTSPSHNDLDTYRNALTMPQTLEAFGISINGTGTISCPVHGERTPSCKVYQDHFHCFGCGVHMDAIGFVQHMEGCDFWGALNWISDAAGLPRPKRDPEAQKRHEAVQGISAIYSQVLHDALIDPDSALVYLESRGISREATTGRVGYLPRNYEPSDKEAAQRAGLYSKVGNFLFSDRVIIPVYHHGRIVSLYGRAVDPTRVPKHIYPCALKPPMPGTLWNLDACRREKVIYLAESIIDAMTLIDRGFPNCAGLFGTQGLTDARLEALKRTAANRIILCLDSDANGSGQTGAVKIGEKLFRAGYQVSVITLPLASGNEKADLNSHFQDHTGDDFRQLPVRDFFDCILNTVPTSGDPQEKYRSLEPILSLVSTQPELTWKEYAERIKSILPGFDQRKLEKEIAQRAKSTKDEEKPREKFLPLSYVQLIQAEAPVICFDGRSYRYESGVYSPWYSEEIDQKIIQLYGPEVQTSHLHSVREFLSSVCFVRPERVNPRGVLNLKNGILDVATGTFKPHSPEVYSTVQSDTSFDVQAECPLWLKSIEEILPDADLRRLLAQIFGYCLTADSGQQKGFLFYGDGGNGKSVITDVLEALAGRENCSALHLSDFRERFRLAELQNKLINFSTEVEAKGLVNDARIKGVITGDPLTAERKNQPPFVFRPFAKLIVCCNNLPGTSDKSGGYFRRWIIIPFGQTFSAKDRDPRRGHTIIRNELSGVLNWAIGGYKSLIDNGSFVEPTMSTEALQEYRRQTDPTIDFVDERLRVMDGGTGSPLKDILKSYQDWAKENGNLPLGRNNFYKAIERTTNREIVKDNDTGARYLEGVFLL
jgi:DNA primase catalytic core